MTRNRRKVTGLITGLIIGALTGGILALIYTPYSGKKFRKMVAKKTDDIMDDVKEYVDTAEDVIKEGRKKVNSLIDDAKKIVSTY